MSLTDATALFADYDVCIVGTGPAGLACGLGCRERGQRVLMLEAGGIQPRPGFPDLIAADIENPECHDPIEIVSAFALGGTSHWWGGRSIPFDPLDFEGWPIRYGEMLPWYEDAGAFLGARGLLGGEAPNGFSRLRSFTATRDETWCPQVNMAKRWRPQLRASDGPTIVTGARVVGLEIADGAVKALRVGIGAGERRVSARHFVLACGGLGSIKLLLLAQRETPGLFGGADGPLGRGYMGHLTGNIADLVLSDPRDADAFAFRPIEPGLYARRRIHSTEGAVREHGLSPIAFWLDDGAKEDPAHGSAVASAKYLAARLFGRPTDDRPLDGHLKNIARAPVTAAAGLGRAAYLLMTTRLTGRMPRSIKFTPVSPGAWHMRYHAEQSPDSDNRITLSANHTDSLGLPRLNIRFRFSDREIESVLRAHELLDADLAQAGVGRLRWRGTREQCAKTIAQLARDGYHQMGGAIMTNDPKRGVVDKHCRTHDLRNLWIASSSTFPTGSHANPTLTIVALARRLAATLAAAPAV